MKLLKSDIAFKEGKEPPILSLGVVMILKSPPTNQGQFSGGAQVVSPSHKAYLSLLVHLAYTKEAKQTFFYPQEKLFYNVQIGHHSVR